MTTVNRRNFLTLAGTAPIGLALAKCTSDNQYEIQIDSANMVDPWLEMNTKNLAWNVKQVQQRIENRPIMAVIKICLFTIFVEKYSFKRNAISSGLCVNCGEKRNKLMNCAI